MELPIELVTQFAKITNDTKDPITESTIQGTIVEYEGHKYVRLDGSELLTPISSTADAVENDRVLVTIQNHTATVTGNLTSPAARTDDLKEANDRISEFDTIVSYKVTTQDLEAINATIESLLAKTARFENMEAVEADIHRLYAKIAEVDRLSATDIEAIHADIETLRAKFGTFTDISTEDLEAINADIANLKGHTADFTYVSADVLTAIKAKIKELDAKKMSADQADIKYANIDFANIGEAAIRKIFSDSGLIKDLVVGDQKIAGELVGVTLKGDLIEGNTVKADKLVVKGSDGIYYKLNIEAGAFKDGEAVPTDSLHGSVITAKSITAEKVSVKDLVAFGATIGSFVITDEAIHSAGKGTVEATTPGVYQDRDGQFAVGDGDNYIRFYKDKKTGEFRMAMKAAEFRLSSGNTVEKELDGIREEMTTNLKIESSRGTVFKNNSISTVLSAVVYRGTKRITNSVDLQKEMPNAYLQWKWQRVDDSTFGTIAASDSMIGDNGFTLTISPDKVDTKVTFMCELIEGE